MIINIDLSGQTQSSRLQRPRREGKYTRGITSDPIQIPPGTIERSLLPSRFSTCDEGSKKKGDDTFAFFPFTVRIPDLAKILTVREIFKRILSRYTEQVRPVFPSRKSNSYELARLREAIFLDEFYARYNLARVAKFRPPPRKETVARGKIQTTSRISRIVDFFFGRTSVRFYAKPNIACIWNNGVTHLRCRNEKSYLKVRGNSWKFVHAVPPE